MPSSAKSSKATSEKTQRWIEAAKKLSKDATATVACPVCAEGKLDISDSPFPSGVGVERHMRCNRCGAYNALRSEAP